MNDKYITREELAERDERLIKLLSKELGDRLDKAIEKQDERLGKVIEKQDERLGKAIEKQDERLGKAFKEQNEQLNRSFNKIREESDKRIMAFEKAQTDRLLMTLSKYGAWTEKHEKFYNHIKDGLKDDE